MSRKSAQAGFTPLVVLLVVAVVVAVVLVVKMKLLPGSVTTPSYTPVAHVTSPKPKVDTTKTANIAPATQSAKPAPEAQVASYISCPKYTGDGAVAYPPFPATGPAPLTALMYAAGSVASGQGDNLASYDWDFQGDGVWDTTVTQMGIQHVYSSAGTYTPKFRVRSTQGMVGPTCTYPYKVVVDNGQPTTNPISINRATITTNMNKSNPNTSLMQQDNATYSDGYLYGDGFVVSLLKSNSWQLVNITSSPITFDQTARSGSVGESFRVHAVAPATLANGTYKTSGDLQYFMNGVWTTFANISLTVNIAD